MRKYLSWIFGLAMACVLCGAGPNVVRGFITPKKFEFRQIVPVDVDGGWRAVCFRAAFIHGNTGATVRCTFTVGVPIRLRLDAPPPRDITLEHAQEAGAAAANQAAYLVLSRASPDAMSAVLCGAFVEEYNRLLKSSVPGSRVNSTCLHDIPIIPVSPDGL
jgi:hypothetical protein